MAEFGFHPLDFIGPIGNLDFLQYNIPNAISLHHFINQFLHK